MIVYVQGRTEDRKKGGHDSCPVDNPPPLSKTQRISVESMFMFLSVDSG